MPFVTVAGAHGAIVKLEFETQAYASLVGHEFGGTIAALLPIPGAYTIGTGEDRVAIGGTLQGALADGARPLVQDPATYVSVVDTNPDAGQAITNGEDSNLLLSLAAGSGTFIGGGADTISVTANDWAVLTSGPSGSVVSTSGNDDTVVAGGADTITAGGGSTTVFDVGGAVVTGGSGFLQYIGGANDSTIHGGSGELVAFSGSGTDTYTLGSGLSLIVGGTGTSLITGGTGLGLIYGNDGTTIDFSGATSNNLLIAGTGNETLNAGGASGSNVFFAGAGNDSLVGGTGNDILVGGSGDSTLTGGAGGNLFVFNEQTDGSTSTDIITDFNAQDAVYLSTGMTYAEGTDSSGDLSLTLSDGTTIDFKGITSIDASQVHIPG